MFVPTFVAELVAEILCNSNPGPGQPIANQGKLLPVFPETRVHVLLELCVGVIELLFTATNDKTEVMDAGGWKDLLVKIVQNVPDEFRKPVRTKAIPLPVHHFR